MRRSFLRFHKAAAILTIYGLMSPVFAFAIDGKPASKSLSDDQKIIHVLNRLGFGARPGDVEKVRAISPIAEACNLDDAPEPFYLQTGAFELIARIARALMFVPIGLPFGSCAQPSAIR